MSLLFHQAERGLLLARIGAILFNEVMSLPVYQTITLKAQVLDDIQSILSPEMNLKHPVVLNLKFLDLDQQREVIGLIENFFVTENLSFKFPYPVYLISDHQPSITKMSMVKESNELPQFFSQKESRMNVRESHLASRNRLLQQEIKNSDPSVHLSELRAYGEQHRLIFELEQERQFLGSILNKLVKVKK